MPSKRIGATCGALVFCMAANISVANAGDIASGHDWTGFYIGLSGGYFDSETDLSHPVFLPFSTNTDGAVVGLYVGLQSSDRKRCTWT